MPKLSIQNEPTVRRCTSSQQHHLENTLDIELIRLSKQSLHIELPIKNRHRSVGAMLSGDWVKQYGSQGLADHTLNIHLTGTAGQSFGAFLARGITLNLKGDANDYVAKGLSGGCVIVRSAADFSHGKTPQVIAGNTVLYGATSGALFCNGAAGERFAVRNSGATAVVEGVGDHACEYMTGGTVLILGKIGRNFGAGMSGGSVYVYDPDTDFTQSCSLDTLVLEPLCAQNTDEQLVIHLLEQHLTHTKSEKTRHLLACWENEKKHFVKVMPIEYKNALSRNKTN